ncbi:MAG TPA: YdeI/OmpD-associated family protein [Saprospiraceae bacterium]|nr:YdeI/OmpD-associated family protein [Saprospiraceae bacterium]
MLEEEPKALSFYNQLAISDQKAFLDWITASKSEHIKEERIAKSIDLMLENKKINSLTS